MYFFRSRSCRCQSGATRSVSCHELEDEHELVLRVDHIMQADDVGMLKLLHDRDLADGRRRRALLGICGVRCAQVSAPAPRWISLSATIELSTRLRPCRRQISAPLDSGPCARSHTSPRRASRPARRLASRVESADRERLGAAPTRASRASGRRWTGAWRVETRVSMSGEASDERWARAGEDSRRGWTRIATRTG